MHSNRSILYQYCFHICSQKWGHNHVSPTTIKSPYEKLKSHLIYRRVAPIICSINTWILYAYIWLLNDAVSSLAGRSSWEFLLGDQVVLVFFELHHSVEIDQEGEELFLTFLLVFFNFFQFAFCPHIDTAANKDLKYEDQNECQGVPMQRQVLLPIFFLSSLSCCRHLSFILTHILKEAFVLLHTLLAYNPVVSGLNAWKLVLVALLGYCVPSWTYLSADCQHQHDN